MASAAYQLLLSAMRDKRQIFCVYQGEPREICPILLGRTGLSEKALVFQFDGHTSKGAIPPPGEWKCFVIAEIENPVLRDGPWHAGSSHSASSHCMKMVEYDVNPDSPYDPAFRL
jgi:hypothetical protein